jgi:hypothetical protein
VIVIVPFRLGSKLVPLISNEPPRSPSILPSGPGRSGNDPVANGSLAFDFWFIRNLAWLQFELKPFRIGPPRRRNDSFQSIVFYFAREVEITVFNVN